MSWFGVWARRIEKAVRGLIAGLFIVYGIAAPRVTEFYMSCVVWGRRLKLVFAALLRDGIGGGVDRSGSNGVILSGIVYQVNFVSCDVLIEEGAIVVGCLFNQCDIVMKEYSYLSGAVCFGSQIHVGNFVQIKNTEMDNSYWNDVGAQL